MKLSTVKLLVPIVAVAIQANSASTVIPPYLDHMRIPVGLIGTLISLAPLLALASRLPVGMAYNHQRARFLVSIAILVMGATNYLYSFATRQSQLCARAFVQWFCLWRRNDALYGVLR